MKSHRLSKSKFVLGLQCGKALYLNIHDPDLAGEISESTQMIFDQGNKVGLLAQKEFPGGTIIDAPYNKSELAISQTVDAIKSDALSIYEATFEFGGVLVKVDILTRKNLKAEWEIVEVKSSTGVKDVHIQDAAIQTWVLRGAGIKIKTASIMFINNECVFPELSNLFSRVDVTSDVEALQNKIPLQIKDFQKILAKETEPEIDIGPHCDDPYECAFKDHCWSKKKIPEISIFDIPRLATKTKWELYNKGTIALETIGALKLNPTQKRMVAHTNSKKRFVDKAGIQKEIANWEYPLSFLDFETIAYAIPRYKGTTPYQQLPFQFSCHIQKSASKRLDHVEYLHLNETDPREAIVLSLTKKIPDSGSIVAYNMGFERGVLIALADEFPKSAKKLKSITDRLVDPIPVFRAHVYDRKFMGSFSIKEVAPAILGKSASYEGMSVGGGTEAQTAFLELIDARTTAVRKKELRDGLIGYCKKDTMNMVELVWWLQRQGGLVE